MLGLLTSGCSGVLSSGNEGAIQIASERLGNQTITPTTCEAGADEFFLGGDFSDEKSGMVVRLVVDPLIGPAIRVFAADSPWEKSIVFQRDACQVFHFSLNSTGWRVNHVDEYRLSLEVDCARDGGESVRGKISAASCH